MLKTIVIALAILVGIGTVSPSFAGPTLDTRTGLPIRYVEQPVTSVNDRNFNRYWPDKINFVEWTSAHPARIYSSVLSMPDGRKLTVTMLGGNNDGDCGVTACSMRLFNGNDQVAELSVCEDMSRHQIADDQVTLLACGKAFNLIEATVKGEAERHNTETNMLHNGSVVSIGHGDGEAVIITYLEPRKGLPRSLKGQILFRGTESKTHQFVGIAYTFKNGCPAAPYNVSGSLDSNGELLLSGQAPVRDAKSCAVLGYTTQSGNAQLIFANILPPD